MKSILITLSLILSINIETQAQKFVIHFPFNSSDIISPEALRLDSFIKAVPGMALSVSGHTDSRGSAAYNEALSKRRADAVKDYLLKNNYPPELLLNEQAFGESNLITADDAEEAKGLVNRRVEIVWKTPAEVPVADEKNTGSVLQKMKDTRGIDEQIRDNSVKKGSLLIMQNLNFYGGRHRIVPSSLPQLQSLLNAMRENPRLKISIEGHICCIDENEDGLDFDTRTKDLSFQRAKAISDYLVYLGINQDRIVYKGMAHSMPLYPYPEKNEEEMLANRRVEIRILEK